MTHDAASAALRLATVDDEARMTLDAPGVARLRVGLTAEVDLGQIPAAFGDKLPTWLGLPDGRDPSGLARYLCDLESRVLPDRIGVFRKAAVVSVGCPRRMGDNWEIAIEWRATSLAPLFPVFVGTLRVSASDVALDGTYAPPFGELGYRLDRLLLSIAARATGRWILGKVAGVVART